MRKETCSIVGPYDEKLALDDWDMYLRLASVERLGFHDGYVGKYRIHGRNSTLTNGAGLLRDAVEIGRRHAQNVGGIASLRLAGLGALSQYFESKSQPRKSLLFLKSGALLFLSQCVHRPIRLTLWLRYKCLGR